MRRSDRAVTDPARILDIVDRCQVLRLGLTDGPLPYIVPVNFAYTADGDELAFYLHGAMAGRKYDLLRQAERCSFELDLPGALECLPEQGDITQRYECVMGTARVTFLEGAEKEQAMDQILLARHEATRGFPYDRARLAGTAVVKLTVETLSCKANLPGGGPD